MITTISKSDFIDTFKKSDTYKDNFTYEGLETLFDYLEELESDLCEQIEFDMVCIACDYSEYQTAYDAMQQYQPEDMPVIDMEEHAGIDLVELQALQEAEALEWLEDKTEVINFDEGVIIRNF
jgi:hypothetical protein